MKKSTVKTASLLLPCTLVDSDQKAINKLLDRISDTMKDVNMIESLNKP